MKGKLETKKLEMFSSIRFNKELLKTFEINKYKNKKAPPFKIILNATIEANEGILLSIINL